MRMVCWGDRRMVEAAVYMLRSADSQHAVTGDQYSTVQRSALQPGPRGYNVCKLKRTLYHTSATGESRCPRYPRPYVLCQWYEDMIQHTTQTIISYLYFLDDDYGTKPAAILIVLTGSVWNMEQLRRSKHSDPIYIFWQLYNLIHVHIYRGWSHVLTS